MSFFNFTQNNNESTATWNGFTSKRNQDSDNNLTPETGPAPVDVDDNGIVDGSGVVQDSTSATTITPYQIYSLQNGGTAITLRNGHGQTFSDASNPNWNVIKSSSFGSGAGFQVLLEGNNSRSGQYFVWTTDSNGVITDSSEWKTGAEMVAEGYEQIFNHDFNNDNSFSAPEPSDWDDNGIIDGSQDTAYAFFDLFNGGTPIELTNSRGKTYNDSSNRNWNAIQAVTHENHDGFLVLLEGSGERAGTYYVWATNPEGVIQGGSDWRTAQQMVDEGYEEVFNRRFDDDNSNQEPPTEEPPTEEPPTEEPPTEEPPAEEPPAEEPPTEEPPTEEPPTEEPPTEEPPTNGDDYGSTPGDSGSIEVESTATGELEVAGDRDWFSIELEAGKGYKFDLEGDTLSDTFMRLYNENGQLINYDDDGGSGYNSRINITAENSGTYYIGAGGYGDQATGSYTLSAVELAPPPEGYNVQNGYGDVSVSRAFETLLDIEIPDVPELGGNLWGVDQVDAPAVWAATGNTGMNITVAVIDTGVDLDHPEFAGRIVPGYDFVDDDTVADDGHSHGTHVAGTIAGANDGEGITGVSPDANIMPIRVLNNRGSGSLSDVIAGIRWAADNGADVINLSLGGGGYTQAMADAVQHASELGSVVVMAAGNSGGSSPGFPAAHAVNHGLAIGAVDQQHNMPRFSNRAGSTVLDYVTAPGVDVYSAVPGGGYASYSGTSMATPHVAGVAALIKDQDPSISASAVEDLITGSGSNFDSTQQSFGVSEFDIPEAMMEDDMDIITLKNIDSFSNKQLKKPLIASLSGGEKYRKSTATMLDGMTMSSFNNDIKSFNIIDHTDNSFAVLDLNNSKKIDHGSVIENLLSSGQVNYFEFDQKMSAI
jgi:subtilisin family serine protease